MCRESDRKNFPRLVARGVQLALLGALLVAGTAQAQVWTGEELRTSGDWVEMSYADGPGGSRTYSVEGTSLRWEKGSLAECGVAGRGRRCIFERTFRMKLPRGCVGPLGPFGPFSVSYHYTNEGSPGHSFPADNDLTVGIGSATRLLSNTTGDNTPLEVDLLTFSDLDDPAFNGWAVLASGDFIASPVGTEVRVEAMYDLSAGSSWSLAAEGSSTSHPTPTMVSATTTSVPPVGEQLYLFLTSGDRSEQFLFHSITLDGCSVEDRIEDLSEFVESVGLNSGNEKALVQALEHALGKLEQENTAAAIKFLEDFRKKVENWSGKQIPEADDADLILQAVDFIISLLKSELCPCTDTFRFIIDDVASELGQSGNVSYSVDGYGPDDRVIDTLFDHGFGASSVLGWGVAAAGTCGYVEKPAEVPYTRPPGPETQQLDPQELDACLAVMDGIFNELGCPPQEGELCSP